MRLAPLVRRDLARSGRRMLLVSVAVAVGVAVMVVFGSLGFGLYRGVVVPLLPRLPLDIIKVDPKVLSLGLFSFDAKTLGGGLDAAAIERLERTEGVRHVYPMVGASFPLRAEGGARFIGHAIRTDLFATGLDPELVKGSAAPGFVFEDPGPEAEIIPVLVARRLLDLYNSTVAGAIDRPRLSEEAVIGFSFDLILGSSYVRGTPDPAKVQKKIARIVGFSDHATLVGITVPEATIKRWNQDHSQGRNPIVAAYVKTRSPADAGAVTREVELLGLAVDDTMKIVSAVVAGAGSLALLFALVLYGLAAFAIAQTFFLLITERRMELSVLRAIGAQKRDLVLLVLIEAAIVGFLGSLAGLIGGIGFASGADRIALDLIPDIPFKPLSLVAFPGALLLLALLLGILASLLGALLPALGAAASDPSRALRS